jgi:hypothetical protein
MVKKAFSDFSSPIRCTFTEPGLAANWPENELKCSSTDFVETQHTSMCEAINYLK